MTLRHLTRKYLEESTDTLRTVETRKGVRGVLSHCDRYLGEPLPGKVTEAMLADYCRHGDVAPTTIRKRRTVIEGFFAWSARQGHIKTNPAVDLKHAVKVKNKGVKKRHWLTSGQVHDIIAGSADERERVILSLGFNTGLRCSELAALTWGNVDFEQNRIHVFGKGEKHGVVGITADLAEILRAWKPEDCRADWPVICQKDRTTPGYARERAVGKRPIQRTVSDAGKRIGVGGFAPHDMRRSLAGILEDKGAPIEVISKVLRHDNIATTQMYLQDSPAKAVDFLSGFTI